MTGARCVSGTSLLVIENAQNPDSLHNLPKTDLWPLDGKNFRNAKSANALRSQKVRQQFFNVP